jgi:hypothetical protein
MKTQYLLLLSSVLALQVNAQIGIGTVSPNSTLDLRGSFAPIYRSFTGATALTNGDHTLVFTGVSAATATLPDATTCAGRIYVVKNFSSTLPTPVLTLATVSSQLIDGFSTWLLNQSSQSVMVISDGNNWEVFNQYIPASAGSYWSLGGNNVTGLMTLGTTSAYDLPFITNNTEKMRITSAGDVGVGSTTFSASPEALLVYQNNPTSFNVIGGKGNLNNYLQLNIQNQNNGNNASSDVVATADNGSETSNYVDLGMNSSTYSTSTITGGPDNAYLYSAANDFVIGNSTAGKNLIFFTGGSASTNEAMRINGSGNIGMGTTNPGNKVEINSGIGGASGLRLKELPSGAVLFMSSTSDVTQNNNNFYFDAVNYRLSVAAGQTPASTLQVGGSVGTAIVTKTANYTASVSDYTILCNNTVAAITIGLPTAAGCAGRIYVIKKISPAGYTVTVDGFGSETIDGNLTYALILQYSFIMIQSDGTSWWIL